MRKRSQSLLLFVVMSVIIISLQQRMAVLVTPTEPCDNPQKSELMAYQKASDVWNELHTICAQHRQGSKVSGGIFLYPRQSFLFVRLIQSLERIIPKHRSTIRVCETGFGGGHSSALFLAASSRVQLITFDKFDRPYQQPAVQLLKERFGPHRITAIAGDTCLTVPQYLNSNNNANTNGTTPTIQPSSSQQQHTTPYYCDVIHGSSFCKTDMRDLVTYLKPNGIVTATAMNSLMEKSVYFGDEKAQWRQLLRQQCITTPQCYEEKEIVLNQTYVFAKKGTTMKHKFCVAQSTGTCTTATSRDDAHTTTITVAAAAAAAAPPPPKLTGLKKLKQCSDISRVPIPPY